MKILIRNPQRREVELSGPRRVEQILTELSLHEGSHVVVRGDEILTRDDLVKDDECVEIISAMSGGV